MKKKIKKPNELMIKSVLDDLKNQSEDPSLRPSEPAPASAFGSIFLDASKDNEYDDTGSSQPHKKSPHRSPQGPAGLLDDPKISRPSGRNSSEDDKTTVLVAPPGRGRDEDHEKTVPVQRPSAKPMERVPYVAPSPPPHRASAYEAQFLQADNLKVAQGRITELEKDVERLRKENEMLSSANEIGKQKNEDLLTKIQTIERQKFDLKDSNDSELQIFKEGLAAKDNQIQRLKIKVEEFESRLANDLRKIRVRERELENRLELTKLEKMALVRSKDENILELKRRGESLEVEIENLQNKILDLNEKIEANQEQFGRTVRALRIALTNLEVNESTGSITLAPLKKAD